MRHVEVPVKVTAWVDERVAPLVSALNEFDQVMTLDSCEGDGGERHAYVWFRCQGSDPASFATCLAAALAVHVDEVDYRLRVEWLAEAGEPLIELACPTNQVEALAGLVSAYRTTPSADGTSRIEPGSLRVHRFHQPT